MDSEQQGVAVNETAPATVNEMSASVEPQETPVTPEVANTETNGAEPATKETQVKELIAQRKRRQQAEKEAEYWRGVAEARGGYPQEAQPRQQHPQYNSDGLAPPPMQPTLEQFETFEEYERAKDEYLVQQAEYRIAQKFVQYQQQQQHQKLQASFQQQIEREAAQDPTIYDIVQDPTLPISQAMVPVLQVSDVAPQVLKWLHNNRQEAARIAMLPPILAAKEIGLVEARIKHSPPPAPPKKVSQAPDPIPTVNPSGSVKEFDPETASMEEYYKHRMAQIRLRR